MSFNEMFAALVGIRFPGGCNHCDAWQEMRLDHGVHLITISHDDDCPTWLQIQARREDTR